MGLVVLHWYESGAGLLCTFAGITGGKELRVQVMGNDIELSAQEVCCPFYGLLEINECRRIAHVAYVGGRDTVTIPVDGDVCIKFRPDAKDAGIP